MTNKIKINTLLAGAVALSAMSIPMQANAMKQATGSEKCYGVVKAGMNGCGSADQAHSCAGQATVDGSGVEWVSVPEGLCNKLVGGSLEPIMPIEEPVSEVPAAE
jgi:uncharacterized membrane protein